MIKADTGKIGINTITPSEFLDVVGNIQCSGFYKGDGSQLSGITDTQYLLGSNLSFNTSTSPHAINLDTSLTGITGVQATSNNLIIKTTTNNDIVFEQNNTAICKVGSTGFTIRIRLTLPPFDQQVTG